MRLPPSSEASACTAVPPLPAPAARHACMLLPAGSVTVHRARCRRYSRSGSLFPPVPELLISLDEATKCAALQLLPPAGAATVSGTLADSERGSLRVGSSDQTNGAKQSR